MKDLDRIAKFERAISEKYGEEATYHPRRDWDLNDEDEYRQQSQELYEKMNSLRQECKMEEKKGFVVEKKLVSVETGRVCDICDKYSFQPADDLYFNRFECCYECYINYVEGREDKWPKRKEELKNNGSLWSS